MPAGEGVPPAQLPPLRRVLGRLGMMGELFEVEEALEKRLPGGAHVRRRAGRGHDGLVGARRLHASILSAFSANARQDARHVQ